MTLFHFLNDIKILIQNLIRNVYFSVSFCICMQFTLKKEFYRLNQKIKNKK